MNREKYRKPLSKRDDMMQDDQFSRELSKQGKDGKLLRLLYLQESMITYRRRVNDEPLHY